MSSNGTQQPNTGIISIHGRQYHTVAKRLADFRKEHKVEEGWMVVTEILKWSPEECLARASLVDPKGVTISTGHAYEQAKLIADSMADSLVEVAETSAVGRALAFAGYGGSGEIASADEIQRRETRQLVGAQKLRTVVLTLRLLIEKEDGFGLLQLQEEWTNDEWIYIWRTMQSWERTAAKKLIAAARAEAEAPDPNYIDPQPLPNERAEKEAARAKANG